MNSNRRRLCQTSWLLATVLFLPGALSAADGPAPFPPWQAELNADRTVQAALLLSPPRDVAEVHASRQKLAQAYRHLAAKYPDAFPVQRAVGDSLAQLDDLQAGVPYWQRAAALDPKSAEVADSLGSAYLQTGQVREASEQYQRAVDNRPDVAGYHSDLANVLYLFRRQLVFSPALPDEQAVLRLALEHFRRAAELSPGNLQLAKAYAETFYIFAQPDWTQALAAWKSVRALSGEKQDFANVHLARISLRLGRRAEAEGYLDAIHDPAFAELKGKLLRQAAQLEASPAPLSSPSPIL